MLVLHSLYATVLIIVTMLAAPGTRGADLREDIPDELTAALAEVDYPPFYFVEQGQLTGISIDVLEHVAGNLGIRIRYTRLSWPRVLQSLEFGRVDMITTFFQTPARARYVVYTGESHASESNHFFTRKGSEVTFNGDLQTLSGYLIGTIRGYSYGDAFDDAGFLTTDAVLDERTLVRMVAGDRFKLAIGNPFAIRQEALNQGVADQLAFLDPAVDSSPIFMGFSRELKWADELAEHFTEAIRAFKDTARYQQLLERYALAE